MTEVDDLGDGISQITLPLPIPRLPSVNAFVFAGPAGVTVIDPGGGHEDGYRALRAGLAKLGHQLADLEAVVITHLHPDHMGVATRLVEEAGCAYVMHASAPERIDGFNDWGPIRRRIAAQAAANGAPAEWVEVLAQDDPRPAWAPPSMVPTDTVEDGDEIPVAPGRNLQVVHTPGHDESHICLVDSETGALFSGDHVLPRITPFVPYPEERDDNLAAFLDSLEKIVAIDPPVTYPAHLDTVERGGGRARQIQLHHRRRLNGMREIIERGPTTAWAVMAETFKPNLSPMHTRLALQETLTHLDYLHRRHRIARAEADGVFTYHRVGKRP